MATFVVLYKFTEQGVRNIKDSPKRTEAAVKAAARAGMTIRETLWLQGEYDFMAIVEGPTIWRRLRSTSIFSSWAMFVPTPCAPSPLRR